MRKEDKLNPVNLVTLQDLNENYFQTGIRELIGFIKRSTNKDALRKYCSENEQRIMEMDEELLEKGREQGIEALVLDYLEEGFTDTRIMEKLQKRFGLDAASAQKYFMKYASGQENV